MTLTTFHRGLRYATSVENQENDTNIVTPSQIQETMCI